MILPLSSFLNDKDNYHLKTSSLETSSCCECLALDINLLKHPLHCDRRIYTLCSWALHAFVCQEYILKSPEEMFNTHIIVVITLYTLLLV